MAFDISKFDQSGFDISGSDDRSIEVGLVITERIMAIVGTSSVINASVAMNERVTQILRGELTRTVTAEMAETVDELVAEGFTSIVLEAVLEETVGKESIEISANIAPRPVSTETVTGTLSLGSVSIVDASMTETVTPEILISADLSIAPELFELVGASASSESVDLKTCQIGTAQNHFVLRPGQRLIIDASNYNVLVDGENAIWYQFGDWLDELNCNDSYAPPL